MARIILSGTSDSVSVWQDAPRDVLIEIFRQCIEPLKRQQPDTTVAPMILCQVCSYWRYVALSAPQLWDSLYHTCILVLPREQRVEVPLRKCIRSQDVQFLKWWSKNLQMKSPSLRLRINWCRDTHKLENPDLSLDDGDNAAHPEDQSPFFETLISSARYLDLDPSYISFLFNWISPNPFIFPNLNTLVIRHDTNTSTMAATMFGGYHTAPLDAARAHLRHLHLETFKFWDRRSLVSFNWSNLTNTCLLNIHILLPIWHCLIRSLTSLQTGSFHIISLVVSEHFPGLITYTDDTPPSPATLPLLHTLHLSLPSHRTLTSQILHSLSLPSLLRLRLVSPGLSLSSLHTILSSTPALTQLQLCGSIPFCWTSHTISIPPALPPHPTQSACTPLVQLLPNLTHLLLDGSFLNNHMVISWVRSVLSSPWLQLPTRGQPYDPAAVAAHEGIRTRRGIIHLELAICNPSNILSGDDDGVSAHAQFTLTPPTNNGWVATSLFSMERSSYVLQKLKSIVASCELDQSVKVVIRGPDAPKLWPGDIVNEDTNPTFDVPGFFSSTTSL